MVERRRKLSLPVNGEEVSVPRSPHLACPGCGEILLRADEVRLLQSRALEIYREKYDLLSAEAIRALRLRLEMTQEELGSLLRISANTISRWESGRNVQSASLDTLLRLVQNVPESLVYLSKRAA